MQPWFIVVDKHRRGNVHGVTQEDPFQDSALSNQLLDDRCDIQETHPIGDIERQVFGKRFHLHMLLMAPQTMPVAREAIEHLDPPRLAAFARDKSDLQQG